MENNETHQADFQNDPVTDWVLNSGDQPVIRDGEIINEPDDVEEKAISPGKSLTIAEGKDCWFPIHFSFAGIHHTADVLKKERSVTEYHVTAVLPVIDHLPDPFIVASTLSKEAFDFPVNEDYYPRELGLIIVHAIGNGCNRAEVALA